MVGRRLPLDSNGGLVRGDVFWLSHTTRHSTCIDGDGLAGITLSIEVRGEHPEGVLGACGETKHRKLQVVLVVLGVLDLDPLAIYEHLYSVTLSRLLWIDNHVPSEGDIGCTCVLKDRSQVSRSWNLL